MDSFNIIMYKNILVVDKDPFREYVPNLVNTAYKIEDLFNADLILLTLGNKKYKVLKDRYGDTDRTITVEDEDIFVEML